MESAPDKVCASAGSVLTWESSASAETLNSALHCEWLETNGLGSYACSTIVGANTRKYHGLLVSPNASLTKSHVLLAKMEASLVLNGHEHHLSTNLYDGAVYPDGYRTISEFIPEPHPSTVHQIGSTRLRCSIMMPRGHDGVLLRYQIIEGDEPAILRLYPLLAFRDVHSLTQENSFLCKHMSSEPGRFSIRPYQGLPELHFESHTRTKFVARPQWYRNFHYPREMERGFEHREDLFCPGLFELPLAHRRRSVMAISCIATDIKPARRWRQELKRREQVRRTFAADPEPIARLKTHAEQFIVRDGRDGLSIIAGYPWFGSWGRDAMISVPGLCFHSGRVEDGVAILNTFSSYARDGLIPNYLSPDGERAYNSADASLWYAWAVGEWLAIYQRPKAGRRLFLEPLEQIIDSIVSGRAAGVALENSGLLRTEPQLTWMDARVADIPVTPRAGLAVDINALWIHALNVLLELGKAESEGWKKPLRNIRDSACEAFGPTFWLPDREHLADVVTTAGPDPSLRPNQLLAVSLPIGALRGEQLDKVVESVRRDLSTPVGLRTLSSDDPAYCARYQGGVPQRDAAYHQGTVWPWWVGHYTQARLRRATDPLQTATELAELYHPLLHEHLDSYGIGSIGEVFDGAEPHRPGGCIAQAWSVAEMIRAWAMIQESQTTGTCQDRAS